MPTLVASDTFDRANSTTSMGNSDGPGSLAWTATTQFGIISNLGYCSSGTADTYHTAYLAVAANEVTVSADVTLSGATDRAFAGVTLRFADENNCIKVILAKAQFGAMNQIILRARVAGVDNDIATVTSAGLVNGQTYALKAIIVGTTCEVIVDGVQRVAPTTFNSGLTTQRYGIFNYNGSGDYDDKGTRWNNFSVTDDRPEVPRSRALHDPAAYKRRLTAAQYQQRNRREVPPDNYTGDLAKTLDNATLAAAGGVGASGTVAATLANISLAASGASGAAGSLARTLDNDTSAATGVSGASGSVADTLADTTSAAAGTFTAATPPVDVPTLRPSMPMPRTGGTGRNVRLQLTANLGSVTAHTALRVEFADEELIEIL